MLFPNERDYNSTALIRNDQKVAVRNACVKGAITSCRKEQRRTACQDHTHRPGILAEVYLFIPLVSIIKNPRAVLSGKISVGHCRLFAFWKMVPPRLGVEARAYPRTWKEEKNKSHVGFHRLPRSLCHYLFLCLSSLKRCRQHPRQQYPSDRGASESPFWRNAYEE